MTDALGNDIILGKHYGYSRSQNGVNTVHIGEALHETKKRSSEYDGSTF